MKNKTITNEAIAKSLGFETIRGFQYASPSFYTKIKPKWRRERDNDLRQVWNETRKPKLLKGNGCFPIPNYLQNEQLLKKVLKKFPINLNYRYETKDWTATFIEPAPKTSSSSGPIALYSINSKNMVHAVFGVLAYRFDRTNITWSV